MNNQEQLDQSLELPQPVETSSATAMQGAEVGQTHEQQAAPGGGPAPQATAAQSSAPATTVAPLTGLKSINGTTTDTVAFKADDADLIEKEWVAKAKEIVAHTHGDPYIQNKEINKIKAQYIKKRYNKDIKQTSD
jgi:hypothetical protein